MVDYVFILIIFILFEIYVSSIEMIVKVSGKYKLRSNSFFF